MEKQTFPLTEASIEELKYVVSKAKPGDAIVYKHDSWWLMEIKPTPDLAMVISKPDTL